MVRKWSASAIWLAAIIASAVLLVVIAVVINLFSDNNSPELLPVDTPEGVVQRYLLALNEQNTTQAFGYISSSLSTCTLEQFIQTTSYQRDRNFSASLDHTTTTDKSSVISVSITDSGYDAPFGQNRSSYNIVFTLRLETDGWRFSQPPWPGWCPEQPKPTAEPTREATSLYQTKNGRVAVVSMIEGRPTWKS